MTFGHFLSILAARWRVMLLVLGTAVAAAALVNLLLPKTYTSTVAVLVDVKSPDPVAGVVYPGMNAPSYLATQVDIVQSDRVSQHVVRALRLNESAQMRAKWREATKGVGNFEAWLADWLRKKLEVKPARDSTVISIDYSSPDPKTAMDMANAYAQAYIDVSLELRVDPARQYGRFFDERAKRLREKVEQTRAALTAFQRQSGVVGADERLDVENARLNELSTQLVSLQAASADTASRKAYARTAPDQLQDVLGNPLINGLKSDLSRQEARLQELKERLGDTHPAIVELSASVGELRARIDKETARVGGGVSVSDSVNRARLDEVRASLERQRFKVLRLKEARDRLAVLAADADSAQRAYDGVNVRANQSELESHATLTNLSLLNPASEPIEPASPRTALNLSLALFVGTLLAVGAALLRELHDRRVRFAAEVVQALSIPLLGVLAIKPSGRLFGRRQPQKAAGRIVVVTEPAGPRQDAIVAGPHAALAPVSPSVGQTVAVGPVTEGLALGEILTRTHQLHADQIDAVLTHQRAHGGLFGEAAVSLKLVSGNDVLSALSRQYRYPYVRDGQRRFDAELVTATAPFSSTAEAFRGLRSQLLRHGAHDGARRAVAVVSADGGDGKTFVAANLAIACSQLRQRTLLIDANLRAPRLHKLFGIDTAPGLSGILSGRHALAMPTPTGELPNLFVLPAGAVPPNPLELLESPAFGLLVREWLADFDHVIFDSPSAASGADAGVIAARCGAFISIARRGRTRLEAMVELVSSLRDGSTRSLGFVLNER